MKKVEIEQKRWLLEDFFQVEEVFLRFEKFDGEMSARIRRLNFERGDAAAVLIFNSETEKIILVDQFRYPTYGKGDGWLMEVIAGIVMENESPEETVKREALEETGYRLNRVVPISTFFPSPGGCSERIFLFYAEVRNVDRVEMGGGVEEDNEDIRVMEFSIPGIMEWVESGEIMDAKTLIALYWWKNFQSK